MGWEIRMIAFVIADHLFSLAGDMGDTLNYANFVLDNGSTQYYIWNQLVPLKTVLLHQSYLSRFFVSCVLITLT